MPLDRFLARAAARIRVRHWLRAMASAAIAAGLAIVLLRSAGAGPGVRVAVGAAVAGMVAGAIFWFLGARRGPRAAAATIERADPSLRNLLVTAEQLLTQPSGTRPYMRDRVLAEAGRRAGSIDLRRTVPVARDAVLLLGAVVLLTIASAVSLPAASVLREVGQSANPAIARSSSTPGFTLDVVPPEYSGRSATRLADPVRIGVLAGTRGTLRVNGIERAEARLNDQPLVLTGEGSAPILFEQSGFIAIEGAGFNRLVPLTVIPDRAPDVRITVPAKDLRVTNASASIAIAADADDDLGLRSLELRYTVVSGTGEQFSFTEGTMPASIARASDRQWKLQATLSLAALRLEPGDALIYRAVAADRRPGGAGIASSDTFFVEVAGPGDVPLEGVEMPPDKERYALSQAMIVLKIERLQARETSMTRDALTEAAGNIAAEQRAVRANFIFLLGGEVEDEEAEAEASHEISEGRLVNQARREIVGATVLMTQVERALGALSTKEALPPARAAVKALQRAFGHSRYLLRALPSRARIDPARRLSGDVSSAQDWARILAPPAMDAQADAARRALADVLDASAAMEDATRRPSTVATLTRAAERSLAAGANADLQAAAHETIAARDALANGAVAQAKASLKRAAAPLVRQAQRGRIDGGVIGPGAARIGGAANALPAGPGGLK